MELKQQTIETEPNLPLKVENKKVKLLARLHSADF